MHSIHNIDNWVFQPRELLEVIFVCAQWTKYSQVKIAHLCRHLLPFESLRSRYIYRSTDLSEKVLPHRDTDLEILLALDLVNCTLSDSKVFALY